MATGSRRAQNLSYDFTPDSTGPPALASSQIVDPDVWWRWWLHHRESKVLGVVRWERPPSVPSPRIEIFPNRLGDHHHFVPSMLSKSSHAILMPFVVAETLAKVKMS